MYIEHGEIEIDGCLHDGCVYCSDFSDCDCKCHEPSNFAAIEEDN